MGICDGLMFRLFRVSLYFLFLFFQICNNFLGYALSLLLLRHAVFADYVEKSLGSPQPRIVK